MVRFTSYSHACGFQKEITIELEVLQGRQSK
jgi:hypothetical protein